MTTPKSPPGSVRRHARNISHPMPRRTTKGPLDFDDNSPAQPAESPSITSPTTELDIPTPLSQAQPQTPMESSIPSERHKPRPGTFRTFSHIDLSFLQDRNIYHQIPTDDIPPAFLDAETRPPPGTGLEELLEKGHFRRAAETALLDLLQASPNEAERILQLLYTRLACLVLISHPELAVEETLPLTDFLARSPPGAKDVLPIIPWELRLLLVRLQSIAAVDGRRRGIMALYALAGEVRAQLKDAKASGSEAEIGIWSERLRDLGMCVSDTLVEMGELETATRHLDTLADADIDEVCYRKALLRVRVGDIAGAQRSVDKIQDSERKTILAALTKTANGNYNAAVDGWKDLMEQHPENGLLGQNLAVCLLYTGHIVDARELLERLARETAASPGLLFNLSTVYELCTERSLERKNGLIQHMATSQPRAAGGGWERANADFKL